MINTDAIRNEALKCHKGARVGISVGVASVVFGWIIGSNLHSETIDKNKCVIGHSALKEMLDRATEAMI